MKGAVIGIVAGLVAALVVAIVMNNVQAITGVVGVLGTVLYKALRIVDQKPS